MSSTNLAIYGELTAANGSDTITANDDGVIITNATPGVGTLRPVGFARTVGGAGHLLHHLGAGRERVRHG